MLQWLQVFGRFHMLVLHLPIGLLAGLAAVEFITFIRRRPPAREVTALLVWLAAVSAILAASMGVVLSYENGYAGDVLTQHFYLGLGLAAATLLTAILHARERRLPFRAALILALIILVPTGHLGGTMTHGEGFLTLPLEAESAPTAEVPGTAAAPTPDAAPTTTPTTTTVTFTTAIAPILESRCVGCHGPSRSRGGLALNSPEAIAKGGKHGPVISTTDPASSDLLRRIRLPINHKDHMPPGSKPQPTADELAAIEAWITAGAPFDTAFALPPSPLSSFGDKGEGRGEGSSPTSSPNLPSSEPSPRGERAAPPAAAPSSSAHSEHEHAHAHPAPTAPTPATAPTTPAPAEAVAALRTRLAHVEPVEAGSTLLWIDFAAAATTITDADVESLLAPLNDHIADLSLSRSAITDRAFAVIARMPNLRRLELRSTNVTDAGIAALRAHAHLEELILAQTHLTDAAVDHLAAIGSLTRINIWRSGITADAAIKLSARRQSLVIETGERPVGTPLQTEDTLKLTGDAPVTAPAPAAPDAQALKPLNTVCPVSGKAVDPDYVIIYRGRIIGFCCRHCAEQFWTDPAKFESAIAK